MRGPADIADAALRFDLQGLKPGDVSVGRRRQAHVREVLLLLRRDRDRRRLHADLLIDDTLRQRHAGIEAASSDSRFLARDRAELAAAKRCRSNRLDQVDSVIFGRVDCLLVP